MRPSCNDAGDLDEAACGLLGVGVGTRFAVFYSLLQSARARRSGAEGLGEHRAGWTIAVLRHAAPCNGKLVAQKDAHEDFCMEPKVRVRFAG